MAVNAAVNAPDGGDNEFAPPVAVESALVWGGLDVKPDAPPHEHVERYWACAMALATARRSSSVPSRTKYGRHSPAPGTAAPEPAPARQRAAAGQGM
jgi:hypothetical protein